MAYFCLNSTYHEMMVSLEFAAARLALVPIHRRMDGVFVRSQNVRRFEFLRALIAGKVACLKVRISVIGHVALRPEPFAAHIAHVLSDILVASNV